MELRKQYSKIYFSFGLVLMTPLAMWINTIIQGQKELLSLFHSPISSIISLLMFGLGYNLITMSIEVLET